MNMKSQMMKMNNKKMNRVEMMTMMTKVAVEMKKSMKTKNKKKMMKKMNNKVRMKIATEINNFFKKKS
jgi:hypothetical protein